MKKHAFLTYSLGCRTNQAEINQIANQLTQSGFIPWQKGRTRPDLILINTCAVTAKADRETRKAIRHFRRLYPQAFLVTTGCGVDAREKMGIKLPAADLFVPNSKKAKTATLIIKHFRLSPKQEPSFKDKYSLSGRALLKIQEGCDQFCAYCLVPFLRGQPASFPPTKITSQVKDLEKREIQEVILVGTNLGLYGKELKPPTNLNFLLEEILKKTEINRVSLSSIEPDLINQKLINLFLGNPRLSSYFHLALQSGSASVLKRMGRQTNLKKLLKHLLSVKQKKPEFTFRADILVGFPGETEKEFQETIDFVKKAKIAFAHIFPYSPRPGTKASLWIKKGKIPDPSQEIKRRRVKKLQAAVKRIRLQEGKGLIGKTLPCLFTQKRDSFWQAIASNSWPVKVFSQPKGLRGIIKKIIITQVEASSLISKSPV